MADLLQEMVNKLFEHLRPLLAEQKLPCEHGPARIVGIDEFMYMGEVGGKHSFKHRDTRNYIYLIQASTLGSSPLWELLVPMGPNAFHRGYFDSFLVPGVDDV